MESHTYPYTLNLLLCLSKFKLQSASVVSDDIIKNITQWAEQEVMSGNENESLLILASLNLDDTPDANDVYDYLERFMRESGISYPGDEISALSWLKITLWNINQSTDAKDAEDFLCFFTQYYWDYSPAFFSNVCNYLSGFYFYLFDSYGEQYSTPAEEMTEDELLTCIKERVSQIERKLSHEDWLTFLTRKEVSEGQAKTASERIATVSF